jgi:hypothetical protein
MSLSEASRIVISKEQVSCDLAGEVAILNLKNGVYYGLDPVGTRIWDLIQEPRTFAELRDTLLGEFEVDAARLEADLRDILGQFAEQQLVEITP